MDVVARDYGISPLTPDDIESGLIVVEGHTQVCLCTYIYVFIN